MQFYNFAFLAIVSVWISASVAEICTDSRCEYHFDVRRQRSMTWTNPDNGAEYNVGLNTSNNQLQLIPNCQRIPGSDPLLGSYVPADEVITAGGYIRNVITVNGQFPGPSIEVMEGTEVRAVKQGC